MSNNTNSYKTTNLTFRYLIALFLIALLTIGAYALIQFYIYKMTSDVSMINLSGRQRMLSQKLTKEVLLLTQSQTAERSEQYRELLRTTLGSWSRVHRGLQYGDEHLQLPGNNSEEIQALFTKMEPYYLTMKNGVDSILGSRISAVTTLAPQSTVVRAIVEASPLYLKWMDRAVFQFDKEAQARVKRLKLFETYIVGITFLLLILISLFIFRPMVTRVRTTYSNYQQVNEELRKHREHLEELVDERTGELLSANLALEEEISERKQAAEELRQTTEALEQEHNMFTNGPVVVFKWQNKEGWPVEYTSPNVKDVFGYSVEEFVSGKVSYAEIIAKEDIERVSGEVKAYSESGTDKFNHEPYRIVKKDGKTIWLADYTTIVRDEGGKITHYLGYVIDITEHKQAEEEIRRMSRGVESAGECIVMTDLKGTIQYVNPAFTQMTGYTAEEALGQSPRILKSGRRPQEFYKEMWDTILGGEVWSGEVTNKRKDGTFYDAVLTIAPVFTQSKKLEGFVAVQRDITQQKQAEMELRQAKQQAEISDRLKSTFLSIMSHEVRTPLNAILGFNDLLSHELKEKLSKEQKEYIETIQKSGERLKHLMDDILDISQIEADRTVLKLGSFMGDDLVKKSVTEIVLSAREKNLEVIEKCEAPELRIRLDDLRFQQALGNILQNAVKFTHKGRITITTKVEDDEYRVMVKDTGIGIRDEFKPYLFSLFRQAEEGYDRSYEGAGLGLAISQRLVEAMNGRIEVESKVGEGSTFTIIMPTEREKAPADQPKVAVEEEVRAQTSVQPTISAVKDRAEKATVLILEDNPANLKFNEFLVRRLNLDHISAETGEKALELLNGQSVDGMLIDISLAEGMTGIEFLEKVKRMEQFKNVPKIAVTAHSMVGDRERFLKHGFNDYLAKPFTLDDLKNTLKRNLVLG